MNISIWCKDEDINDDLAPILAAWLAVCPSNKIGATSLVCSIHLILFL